jgi:preprotein translocase subunit YajC
MLKEKLNKINIILASGSPRRQQFFKEMDLHYTIRLKEIEEIYPEHLQAEEITNFLAELKANAFENELKGKPQNDGQEQATEQFRGGALKVGEKVRIKDNGMAGEVIRVSNKAVTVAIGNITSKMPLDRVERISSNEYKAAVREKHLRIYFPMLITRI